MREFFTKSGLCALFTYGAHYLNAYGILLWILFIFSVLDLVSGMVAAAKKSEINKEKARWGAVKKVGYFALVGVAFLIDLVVYYVGTHFGWHIAFHPFSVLSLGYLIATEAVSILDNLAECGVEVPLLSRYIRSFKNKISSKGEIKHGE